MIQGGQQHFDTLVVESRHREGNISSLTGATSSLKCQVNAPLHTPDELPLQSPCVALLLRDLRLEAPLLLHRPLQSRLRRLHVTGADLKQDVSVVAKALSGG